MLNNLVFEATLISKNKIKKNMTMSKELKLIGCLRMAKLKLVSSFNVVCSILL